MNKTVICIILVVLLFTLGFSKVNAKIKLKSKIPALCYKCHQDLKEGLNDPYVHFLFKQGKCITCHNSHVSNDEGLLTDSLNSLCLNCHEALNNLLKNANAHKAIKNGVCTDCHASHSGKNKKLLLKNERDLCWKCHEGLKEETKKPYGCETFAQGKCSECHNSHASTRDALLRSDPTKLCTRCHAPKCKVGSVSISSVTRKLDCTSCHTGHSSERKGALGPFAHQAFLNKNCEDCHNPITSSKNISVKSNGKELCLDCHTGDDATYIYAPQDLHVKDAENPCVICHSQHAATGENLTKSESSLCIKCHKKIENKTAVMEKNLKDVNCTPVKNRQCFDCHIPMHSDLPYNFRDFPINLCSRCHVAEHSTTHPVGPDIIDPRNGEPVTCISCHSMHDARADFLLTFDRNKALCIQCHKK